MIVASFIWIYKNIDRRISKTKRIRETMSHDDSSRTNNTYYICHSCARYKSHTTTDMKRHFYKKKTCSKGYLRDLSRDVLFMLSLHKKYVVDLTRSLTNADLIYLVTHFDDGKNMITEESFCQKPSNTDRLPSENQHTQLPSDLEDSTTHIPKNMCARCKRVFRSSRNLVNHLGRKSICERNQILRKNDLMNRGIFEEESPCG